MNKKYKALIIDCDGTLVASERNALPTSIVTETILKICSLIHVGVATSRPLFLASPIMKHLKLTGPSIVSAGAQIVDGKTFKILKQQQMASEDISALVSIFKKFRLNFWVQDGDSSDQEMTPDSIPQKAIEIAALGLTSQLADKLKDELSKIEGLSVHKNLSWQQGKNDIVPKC